MNYRKGAWLAAVLCVTGLGVVTLRAGASADPAALIAHCRERLAGYKYPRRVTVLDALPKSATGKVLKARLTIG